MHENQAKRNPLRIWQQNVNKSLNAQLALLHEVTPNDVDLIFLQEPHIDHNKLTRALPAWHVIYPRRHHDYAEKTRSIILVNRRLATNTWTDIEIQSPDITGLTLTLEHGIFHFFNMYLDGDDNRSLVTLTRTCRHLGSTATDRNLPRHMLWAGDFNRHHPMWDEERNHHLFTTANLDKAQTLLNAIASFDLQMLLEQGVPTLEATRTKNLTRPDNVFASEGIVERTLTCTVYPDRRPPYTDHFPVSTEIELTVEEPTDIPRHNFRMVDWDEFKETLKDGLHAQNIPKHIRNKMSFDSTLKGLMTSLQKSIAEHVPVTKPSPYSKRWWSKDLAKQRKDVQKLARKSYKLRSSERHPIHEQWRKARNIYGESIRRVKQEFWEQFLKEADERTIWTVNRFVRADPTDGGKTRVPPLRRETTDASDRSSANEEKSRILYETFFPPSQTSNTPQEDRESHNAKFSLDTISDDQVRATINKLKPYKAPGPDGIPNVVYKECSSTLTPILGRLYRASLGLRIYPDEWKVSNTIVLRKPGRPDYSVGKSYRPIALLNCISKIMSACIADVLSYESERHAILACKHFGGRPGRMTTDSLHLVTKTVKDEWRKGNKTSILFLDIKAAFPSASPERLFSDMQSRGIPKNVIDWLSIKLEGRQTRLIFDDYRSEPFEISSGIDQGCPLSPFLYQLYNSSLLEIADSIPGTTTVGCIDDVAVLASGKTFEDAHAKLRSFME